MVRSVRYSLGILTLSVLLIFGTLYYISTQLSGEEVKLFLVSIIKQAMPNTQVTIKQVDYNLGFSLRFEIQEIDIKLKEDRPGGGLFFVRKAFIRIPIWTIFLKGGEIDIIVSSPQISYYEYRNGANNWNLGKGQVLLHKKIRSLKKEDPLNNALSLPIFLSKGKINIRSNDITVFYQTKEDEEGEFNISKLLIKNMSLNESAVFEIQTPVKVALRQDQFLSSNVLLVGEFDTLGFLEKGLFNSKAEIRLTENRLTGLPPSIPDIRGEIIISKDKSITSELKLNAGDLLDDFKANIILGKTIKISDLEANLNFAPIFEMMGINTWGFKFNKSKVHLSGSIQQDNRPILNLKFRSTSNNIKCILLENPIDIGFSGSIYKRSIRLNIPLGTLSGTGMISVETMLPRNFSEFSWQNLSRTKINIDLDHIKFAKKDIQLLSRIGTPNFRLTLSGRKITIEESLFDFNGLIIAKNNSLSSKRLSINTGIGSARLGFTSKINPFSFQFDMKVSKFPLASLHPIFPEEIKKISGTTKATLSGKLTDTKEGIKYDIKVDSVTTNGEIQGLGINDLITDHIDNVPPLNAQLAEKKVDISDKFQKLTINGRFKEDHYQMKKIDFVGPFTQIKGGGNLFPNTQKKGEIFLIFEGKLEERPVSIPIHLEGLGLSLSPDYPYTARKIK